MEHQKTWNRKSAEQKINGEIPPGPNKTKTRLSFSEIMDANKMFAEWLLLNRGEIIPVVYLHSTDGDVGTLPYEAGSVGHQYAIVETIKALRERHPGLFAHAVLLSEAWLAKIPIKPGEKAPDIKNLPRASEDPNRIEVVIAQVAMDSGQTGAGVWEIVRDAEGKPSLGKAVSMDGGKSWLDAAVKS